MPQGVGPVQSGTYVTSTVPGWPETSQAEPNHPHRRLTSSESKGTWLLAFLLRRRRRVQAMSQLTAEERRRSFEHRLVALAVAGALLMAQTARVVSLQGAPALIEWFLPRV